MSIRRIIESGACADCEWSDGAAGARGRAAQHHNATGHEVTFVKTTTLERAGAPPGQTELAGLEHDAPRPLTFDETQARMERRL